MAKSIRAKVKMANRRKQRERGNYAAADAARVARLSAKLLGKGKGRDQGEGEDEGEGERGKDAAGGEEDGGDEGEEVVGDAEMGDANPPKISTAGARDNRRESWRASKGMVPRPKKGAMNRQGLAGGRSKAGKPKRRR